MEDEHQKCDNRILEQEVRHGFDKINHTVGDIKTDVKDANAETVRNGAKNTDEHNEIKTLMQENMRKLDAVNAKISTMYIYAGALVSIVGAFVLYGRAFG